MSDPIETGVSPVAPPATNAFNHPIIAVSHTDFVDLLMRVPLIIFFGFVASAQLIHIFHLVVDWTTAVRSLQEGVLVLASTVSNLMFSLLLISVTLLRLPATRQYHDLIPKIMAVAGAFLTIGLVLVEPVPLSPAWSIASSTLVAVGMMSSVYVLWRLGKSFSIMPEARALVTDGPYAIVRHPLYVCEEIAIIGLMIKFVTPLGLTIFALHLGTQMVRVLLEENILRATFPEYAAYEKRVPRFIPRPRRGA